MLLQRFILNITRFINNISTVHSLNVHVTIQRGPQTQNNDSQKWGDQSLAIRNLFSQQRGRVRKNGISFGVYFVGFESFGWAEYD